MFNQTWMYGFLHLSIGVSMHVLARALTDICLLFHSCARSTDVAPKTPIVLRVYVSLYVNFGVLHIYVRMYIYIHMYIYVYMYAHIHMYTYVYLYIEHTLT